MTLILLIVGAILLICGYMIPMPPPLALIMRVAGAICLAVGIILLLAWLLGGIALPALHAHA